MKNLNPTLYQAILEWGRKLPNGFDMQAKINTRHHLQNDKETILACLLTEFPKSYRQVYEVYQDLFSDIDVFEMYDHLNIINVLAFGTGSGGDVFGFIHACEEFFCGKQINIFSVEGNKDALISQLNIFKHQIEGNLVSNTITLVPIWHTIEKNFDELDKQLNEVCYKPLGIETFDIIQSIKFMQETKVRSKLRYKDLFGYMNTKLNQNRVAVLLEYADPMSKHKCDREVSIKALKEFVMFCKESNINNKLYALTPTPCVARFMSQLSRTQCSKCQGCFENVKVNMMDEEDCPVERSTYIFGMKLISGALGAQIASSLQDDTIGFKTNWMSGKISDKYCTLNGKVEAEHYGHAFKLCQERE